MKGATELSVGEVIRKYRKKKRLTLPQLCELLNIHQTHISKIERDERTPSLELLTQIVKVLEIPVTEAFDDSAEGSGAKLNSEPRTGSANIQSPILSGLGKEEIELLKTMANLDGDRKNKVLTYAKEQEELEILDRNKSRK